MLSGGIITLTQFTGVSVAEKYWDFNRSTLNIEFLRDCTCQCRDMLDSCFTIFAPLLLIPMQYFCTFNLHITFFISSVPGNPSTKCVFSSIIGHILYLPIPSGFIDVLLELTVSHGICWTSALGVAPCREKSIVMIHLYSREACPPLLNFSQFENHCSDIMCHPTVN